LGDRFHFANRIDAVTDLVEATALESTGPKKRFGEPLEARLQVPACRVGAITGLRQNGTQVPFEPR
jgi:hypothetical protein